MTTDFLSQSDKSAAHTEAAIWAHGTHFTADELFFAWLAECQRQCKTVNPQTVYESVIDRLHKQAPDQFTRPAS
jgi:hypothetical protein